MDLKRSLTALLLLLCCIFSAEAQEIVNNETTHFQLKQKQEIVDFVVFDTVLEQKKPVFLWCQGSLPYPLYIREDRDTTGAEILYLLGGGVTNFDVTAIRKQYHLVVISMPETPFIAPMSELNESYWYAPDPEHKDQATEAFYKADYLDHYVERAHAVLAFLAKQRWVDRSELVVAGHSQGAPVAVQIAAQEKNVTQLGIFGGNPFGRIDQMVRQIRKDAESGRITWEEADRLMKQEYDNYAAANDPEALAVNPGLLAWRTFSVPFIDDLVKLSQPVYVVYGTADIVSDGCDLVPLYCIRAGKKNVTCIRRPNEEHNFFRSMPTVSRTTTTVAGAKS